MLKDTIISAFNYDGTLLKWLKKVEDALQGDTLTNIEVVTNSDYSMQLKLTFGDGTFILSPTFTNKGRGIVTISKTATSGLVDTYTVTYTDNTTSTFTVTNAEGFNANNLYNTLTAGTGIELTNDGQHVTVSAKSLLSDIVDANGNKRFIQGNIDLPNVATDLGITQTYGKWSLSGSHLLIVQCLTIPENVEIGYDMQLGIIRGTPSYIRSKISSIVNDYIVCNSSQMYRQAWVAPESAIIVLRNFVNLTTCALQRIAPTNYTRFLRIQFDLLIDTD